MDVDTNKIRNMFTYLSNQKHTVAQPSTKGDFMDTIGFVFGRKDIILAKKVKDMFKKKFFFNIVVSGGIGKDSKDLETNNMSDAKFISNEIFKDSVLQKNIYLEEESTNSELKCKFGIDKIIKHKLPHKNIILISHATSTLRLYATFMKAIDNNPNFSCDHIIPHATDYEFNAAKEDDQKEVVGEMIRLLIGSKAGFLIPIPALTNDYEFASLMMYAKELHNLGHTNLDYKL